MKTKIKRHSRSVIAVVLTLCMLVSCMTVGLIATDAAKVTDSSTVGATFSDDESVGYDHDITSVSVKGSWEEENGSTWVPHDIKNSDFVINLPANSKFSFVFIDNHHRQFASGSTVSTSISNYNFSVDNNHSITLRTSIAGDYKFHYKSQTSDDTIQVDVTFPVDDTPDTWTAVGAYGTGSNADAGFFGTAWAPTATANDMTKSGTTWSKTWNNVTLDSAQTVYYKVVKNHSWDTAVPAGGNKTTVTLNGNNVDTKTNKVPAGSYNITVTFDGTNNVNMTLTSAAKSTLTVQADISDARVTATYNGTTVGEGQSIQEVPQGATVSVTVIPVSGKQCTGVTGTYNTNSTVAGTGAGQSWSLVMPGAATTVSVTLDTVTMKKIYFNNNYTQYGTVYAYVYDKDTSDKPTYEYLGAKPGKVMTESANSEIWYIDVPNDVDYVEFISGDGKTTGEMKIPWPDSGESQTYTYPKYTAPYNYDAPTIANGGTWGNYIWGSTNKRSNEYTVSDGATMSNSNLFTGITATMYDYYTDGEIEASAGTATDNGANNAPNGWIKGIKSNEYTWEHYDNNRIPYTKLNAALSAYADAAKTRDNTDWANPSEPKYGITYPLYFGDLNTNESDSNVNAHVATLYNWHFGANNSNGLGAGHGNYAQTGLSGNQLGDDNTIHYYKSGATNENGAPMAMFNEDFLSGENNQNAPLATILRTSSFPVRKEILSTLQSLYIDTYGKWVAGVAALNTYKYFAHFYKSADSNQYKDVAFTLVSGNIFSASIPYGYDKVVIAAMPSNATAINWDNMIAKSDDLDVPTSKDRAKFTVSGDATTNDKKLNGNWGNYDNAQVGTHTYYEFDSEHGKDNAYIETINKSDKTAVINYYNNDNKVHSASDTNGFFPFNRNNLLNSDYAQDLGFGMKLTIPFTLEGSGADNGLNLDNTEQTFDFSGDDDLWVFVDNKLVLDLGGAHGRTEGSINFHTKTVTANSTLPIENNVSRNGSFATGFNTNPNYVHTMTIYYMERGMIDSNLRFGFSFHAIPNQFWIDKKIRTKDKDNLGYDTINAGFFNKNNQNGDASNMTTYNVGGKTTTMSKFERSFQNEKFWVTHWYGDPTANQLAENKNYTIDNDTTTHTVGSDGKYPIYHDLGNAFIGQFTTGQQFKLKEEPDGSNKYVYQPVFSVWDQANNDTPLPSKTGDNTNGFTFDFAPTTTVTGGIENTNIKARFENYMVAHNLTLTKELTNTTDPESIFTFQILFDFSTSGTANYVSFPLYCYVDGVRTKLSDTGTIAVKAGQVVVIDEIPEKAKVQVTEVLDDTVSGYRYAGMTLKKGSTVLTKDSDYYEITKGIQFQMGDGDMSAVISNKNPDNKYTIVYKYPSYGASPKTDSLYGEQSYTVTGVFTKSELDSYMTLSNGALAFQNPNAEKTFINNKAPYEDNFMQNLSFANAELTKTGNDGWDAKGDYYCEATTTSTADYTINAYFKLPYAVDNYLIPQESGTTGKVAYSDTKRAYGEKDITCFDWYVTDGPTNKSRQTSQGGTPVFVNAPLIVYQNVDNENTKKYFQYWSVKSQSAYGKRSTEYTRCYDYEFNFALFMDSIIEPVYADTWAQSTGNPHAPTNYKDYERYNPEIQIQGDGINIAFLENSRNQYNNGGNGTRPVNTEAADVIYSDFLLNFNYNATEGLVQLNQLGADKKKAGLVIEAVDYMDYEKENGVPTTNFDFDKNYSEVAKFNENETSQKAAITNWLQGQRSQPEHCVKSEFDVTALDNKNCKQYYYSLNNRKLSSDGQLLNTTQNRYKVFRAYAYIGNVVPNYNTKLASVQISDPVYFTIYDVGSQRLPDNATN